MLIVLLLNLLLLLSVSSADAEGEYQKLDYVAVYLLRWLYLIVLIKQWLLTNVYNANVIGCMDNVHAVKMFVVRMYLLTCQTQMNEKKF